MYFTRTRKGKQQEMELYNFSPKPPTIPLLFMGEYEKMMALKVEKQIMMYMQDLSLEENPSTLLTAITEVVTHNQLVADEAYCFLMKQTTANMKACSEQRGWEMICYLLAHAKPSRTLYPFVLSYIVKALFEVDVQVRNGRTRSIIQSDHSTSC